MTRIRARIATLSATVLGLLLVGGPALAAYKPVPGEHDTLIGGEENAIVLTGVAGVVLGIVTYAMLPKAPDTPDDHH